jgi:hypothetical protein
MAAAEVAQRFQNLDFEQLIIDVDAWADFINRFVGAGADKNALAPDDIKIFVLDTAGATAPSTWDEAREAGTCLFDYLVYLTAKSPSKIKVTTVKAVKQVHSNMDIARALMYVWTFMITQGHAPSINDHVPAILKNIFNLTNPPDFYSKIIASFKIDRLSPVWVQSVKLPKTARELANRLALGAAGHRLLQAFTYIPIPAAINASAQEAATVIKKVAEKGLYWEMHPLFRPAKFFTTFGSLNRLLNNLLLDVYSDEQLKILADEKIIYEVPKRSVRVKSYDTIKEVNFDFLITKMELSVK